MMQNISNIEKLFYEEVKEKKKTASGVHHKTGKNGYVGNMRFPSDIMSRSEKMRYRKAGKVVTTNIFDEVLPIDEFEQLETYEKKNRLAYWRNEKSNKEILQGMGISNKRYYEIVAELQLPKAPRIKPNQPRKATVKKKQEPKESSTPISLTEMVPAVQKLVEALETPKEETKAQEDIVNGLNVSFKGTFSAEKIEKQLTKFMLLLDSEEDDFYVEFRLMQKSE
jgi:hypothetical protein